MTVITETDRGKLWIIRQNGRGRADFTRARSDKQRRWLERAVDRGWLDESGRLTSAGLRLAAEFAEDRS